MDSKLYSRHAFHNQRADPELPGWGDTQGTRDKEAHTCAIHVRQFMLAPSVNKSLHFHTPTVNVATFKQVGTVYVYI